MAGMSLLQGGDNPIFKASQKIAEQEASRKDIAIQGIINQNIQTKAKQLGAELESANAMMQSNDPEFQKMGIESFFGLAGKPVPQGIETRLEEVRTASKAFAKDMGNPSILPYKKMQMLNEFKERWGYLPKGLEGYPEQIKQEQTGFEGGMLSQAAQIPALQKQGMLTPEQAQEGRFSALSQAGQAGTDILKSEIAGKEKPSSYHVVKDPKSKTGFSYQNLANPNESLIPNAPAPSSSRDTSTKEKVFTKIVDKFNRDPNVRKVGLMTQFSDLITDAANSGNPIAQTAIPTLMARASGEVGNLSEADKRPFGGSKAILTRLERVFTEMATGRNTPENLEYIRQLADMFVESGREQKAKIAREWSKQYAAANKGEFTAEEIFNALSPDGDYEPDKTAKEAAKPNKLDNFWR